jgi:hypothetical protein
MSAAAAGPLVVPVNRVSDSRAKSTPKQWDHFWSVIWPEAVRDFGRCGIQFQTRDTSGEIRRFPSGRPRFVGLERGVINLVITDHIPLHWDRGRAAAGVTTLHDGYHLCLIALGSSTTGNEAHGHQIPFLSVNTCVHELLHALMQDIFERRPKWFEANEREFRIDWYATRMWLFSDCAAVRKSAAIYLQRLNSSITVTRGYPQIAEQAFQ